MQNCLQLFLLSNPPPQRGWYCSDFQAVGVLYSSIHIVWAPRVKREIDDCIYAKGRRTNQQKASNHRRDILSKLFFFCFFCSIDTVKLSENDITATVCAVCSGWSCQDTNIFACMLICILALNITMRLSTRITLKQRISASSGSNYTFTTNELLTRQQHKEWTKLIEVPTLLRLIEFAENAP